MKRDRKRIINRYKYVFRTGRNTSIGSKQCWTARVQNKYSSHHNSEKDAALAIDKYLISIGKEPVNILKRR